MGLDFSGDKLAIHVPVSERAVAEVKNPKPTEATQSDVMNWNSELLFRWALENAEHKLSPIDQIGFGTLSTLDGDRCHRPKSSPRPDGLDG